MERKLISVYCGTEASVLLLKGKLDMMGIGSEIRKDSYAGTWGVVPDNIELFIEPGNVKEVESVIEEFRQTRYNEKF